MAADLRGLAMGARWSWAMTGTPGSLWVRERDQAWRPESGGGRGGCRCYCHSVRPRLGAPSRMTVTQIRAPCLPAVWRFLLFQLSDEHIAAPMSL